MLHNSNKLELVLQDHAYKFEMCIYFIHNYIYLLASLRTAQNVITCIISFRNLFLQKL